MIYTFILKCNETTNTKHHEIKLQYRFSPKELLGSDYYWYCLMAYLTGYMLLYLLCDLKQPTSDPEDQGITFTSFPLSFKPTHSQSFRLPGLKKIK